ncbi:hypothetical protein OKW96_10655 [Sphingobacterium sp. KU25419]|nr:hypothetical protein OKW96_10655 [Sphingobacterium sp. KU25419]
MEIKIKGKVPTNCLNKNEMLHMIRNFEIKKTMLFAFIMVISYQFVDAQVQIEMKTEYIGKSDYRNQKAKKVKK